MVVNMNRTKGFAKPSMSLYVSKLQLRHLGSYCKRYIKFTDSQVALFWLNSLDKPLKQFVRGLVIEIRRLSEADRWFYIQSKNNVADIGTRKGAQIKDVDSNSE